MATGISVHHRLHCAVSTPNKLVHFKFFDLRPALIAITSALGPSGQFHSRAPGAKISNALELRAVDKCVGQCITPKLGMEPFMARLGSAIIAGLFKVVPLVP